MSKSLSHILVPALGGTALVLGLALMAANRDYGRDKIESLERRVEQVQTHATTAGAQAKAQAARAADLEQQIAEVQALAEERLAAGVSLTAPAPATGTPFGLGRAAHSEEIAAWDVDVLPDGRGLPEGAGDVYTGEEVFAEQCASCHGDFAEGVDNWPVLAGGFDTLADDDPVKTVGSYWPHLSTAWDYISRSMPFGQAGTLSADETYAIVAYILYSNDLVDDEFELTHENFADFEMYNMNGFVVDDRPEQEYAKWRTEPCMEGCKDAVDVTMRSVFLVETPPEGGTNSVMNEASAEALPSFTADGPSFIPEPAAKPANVDETKVEPAVQPTGAADDTDVLIAAGKKVFRKCGACHKIGEGAKNASGPHLNGIVGRTMGSVEGFRYSPTFKAAHDEGRIWDEESLTAFLAQPKTYLKGTKMAFAGLKKKGDQEAIVAFLNSFRQP